QDDKDRGPQLFSDLETALKVAPAEWRTWHYLTTYYMEQGSFDTGRKHAASAFKNFPDNPIIGMDYAKALLQTGNFKNALDVLGRITILPQEGAREGHDIYELANLWEALNLMKQKKFKKALRYVEAARQWPEHLGAGVPYDPDMRL